MNKQITVLMDTVVFKLKWNSMINFLLKSFQNVIKAHVTCLRMTFYPSPHPKIL